MRNIGGSFGIASVTTILARNMQTHTNVLVGHVSPYDPAAQIMFNNVRAWFLAHGSDAVTATRQAYAAMFVQVHNQAAMLSFIDCFRLLGLMFLLLLPLILLMRRPTHQRAAAAAH